MNPCKSYTIMQCRCGDVSFVRVECYGLELKPEVREGMPITVQGASGRVKSFKETPANESKSGWREIDITVEFE